MSILPITGDGTTLPLKPSVDLQRIVECIQKIVSAILDFLITLWYALVFALDALDSSKRVRKRVFHDSVVVPTQNQGKAEEIRRYVQTRANGVQFSSEVASKHGLTLEKKAFRLSPFSDGFCFGGVALFLKKWFETGDINQVAPLFENGLPFEAVLIQKKYEKGYQMVFYPILQKWILEYASAFKSSPQKDVLLQKEMEKWEDSPFKNGLLILQGLTLYLIEKTVNPEGKVQFESYLVEWLQSRGKTLSGPYLATVRKVAESFDGSHSLHEEIQKTIYQEMGMDFEAIFTDKSPKALLKASQSLAPGAYKISLPVFNSVGKKIGTHAIGLVIEEKGTWHMLEPNIALASKSRKELTATLRRLLTEYVGYKFDENLIGKEPGILPQIGNALLGRANPPETPLTSGVSLHRVTSIS